MIQVSLAVFIWGTIGVFILWADLPMVDIAFYRCLFSILPLTLHCLYKKEFSFKWLNLKNAFLIFLSSAFLVANWLFLFWSFDLASITLGNVSYYLQPVFLVILGLLFLKDKVSAYQWVLIAASLVGVLMTAGLFSGKLTVNEGKHIWIGLSCALVAGLLYAAVTIIAKPMKAIPSSQIALLQLSIGTLLLLPFTQNLPGIFNSNQTLLYIMVIGFIHTGLAYVLYYQGIKNTPITVIAVLSYIDPIVAIVSDVIFFNQRLDLLQLSGIAITLIASYLISTYSPKEIKESTLITDTEKI